MYSSYTSIHWMFFFYFYCFFGWCFESAYVSLKKRKWVNRGFMRGPFLPLYGSGGIMMLLVSMPFQDNIPMVYISGCIGATILEYVTGVVMEALFKVRYWDYSGQRFQFRGHICLSSSLAWGGLTILMTELMHKPVEKLAFWLPYQLLSVLVLILTAVIWADFALSFKAALDLRDVLIKMEEAKKEMERIQKRLDVIIALTSEELSIKKETLENRVEDVRDDIEARWEDAKDDIEKYLEAMRERMQQAPGKYKENIREELLELKVKYTRVIEEREQIIRLKDRFQRSLLRSHPSMSSVRFKEALEELKRRAEEMSRRN